MSNLFLYDGKEWVEISRNGDNGYTPVKGIDYFDGIDGKNGLDGKDGKDGANGSPDTAQDITNKLNGSNETLKLELIKDLPAILRQLDQKPSNFGGSVGGVNLYQDNTLIKEGAVKIKFSGATLSYVNDVVLVTITSGGGGSSPYAPETPSGAIDDANVTFTTLHTINNIFSFAINGMFLHEGIDFTKSGSTITMTSPLGSGLSGRPFTIIYN